MIGGLAIAFGILLIALWGAVMFLWWKKEQHTQDPLATDIAMTYLEKCVRLVRRGWYISEMYLKEASTWGGKKATKVFFSLFPSAVPAFTKRDELAGLKQGPSSFFLMSISEKEKTSSRKIPVRKKTV